MRVAVVNLTNGGFSGGYLKYLRELLPRLAAQPGIGELMVLSPAGSAPTRQQLAPVQLEWPAHDRWSRFSVLRSHLHRLAPDVAFFPTARFVPSAAPAAVMVRNMEPLVMPRVGHGPAVSAANTVRRLAARRACRHAQRVLAVSQFVRDFVVERWHIDADRVGLVYHGVADSAAVEPRQPAALHGPLPSPWLFTAGSLRPARGHVDALHALARLRASGLAPHLVIASAPDPDCRSHYEELRRLEAALGITDQVTWAGRLDEAEMAWCLNECTGFLMTTRIEACPNLALEALHAGTSSIAADNPPLPEFFQGHARYYPPGDADGLATRIRELLATPPAERARLGVAAVARAAEFTWEATAAHTAAELARCAAVPASSR